LLAEFGRIGVLHSHLDYILKMTLRSLTGVSIEEIRLATNYEGSSSLRGRIKKIARKRVGDGAVLIKLQALMERCKQVTAKRNALVHGVYATERFGEPIMSGPDWSWIAQPTLKELQALSVEIERLTNEINDARFRGYLADALKEKQ